MQISRLFGIVYLLLHKGKTTAGELAERFEVSPRTILRDIEILAEAGIPVYGSRGKGGGIALLDSFVLNKAFLSETEQQEILFALQGLSAAPHMDTKATVAKLQNFFAKTDTNWITVEFSRWGNRDEDRRRFETIKNAILDKRSLHFLYANSYGQTGNRAAVPLRLVFKDRAWYLQGFCLVKEAYRTYKISRMHNIEVSEKTHWDRTFQVPEIDPFAADVPGLTECKLRITAAMAYRVYDEFQEESIEKAADGSFLITAKLPLDEWLCGYLLSFGAAVKVLEPPQLRNAVAKMAAEIFMHYEGEYDGQMSHSTSYDKGKRKKEGHAIMKEKFCQSCGMPLGNGDEMLGTETDGSKSPLYCQYCYQNGAFTADVTLEGMVEICVPPLVSAHPGMGEEEARRMMRQILPTLKRWQ